MFRDLEVHVEIKIGVHTNLFFFFFFFLGGGGGSVRGVMDHYLIIALHSDDLWLVWLLPKHPWNYSLIHSIAHSSIHSFIRSFVRSFIHSFMH